MKPVFFLITSISDIKQDGFAVKLRTLLDQQVPVHILFAILNYSKRQEFDDVLARLGVQNQALVSVISLHDVFARMKGSSLSAKTLLSPDLTNLTPQRRSSDTGEIVRYLRDDQLLEERHYTHDNQLTSQDVYRHNQLVQAIYYDGKQTPVVINNYQGGYVQETLLLNDEGQLVFRIMRAKHTVQKLFNVTETANVQLTHLQVAPEKKGHDKTQTLTVIDERASTYRIIDYADGMTFSGRYDFYRYALQQLGFPNFHLYASVAHNVELSTALPNQLIYNY